VDAESARTVASATGSNDIVAVDGDGVGVRIGVGVGVGVRVGVEEDLGVGVGVRVGDGGTDVAGGEAVGVGFPATIETPSTQTFPIAPPRLKCNEMSEFDMLDRYEKLNACHTVVSENRFSAYTAYGEAVCWSTASSVRGAPALAESATVYVCPLVIASLL
jgi:hypothetical protein